VNKRLALPSQYWSEYKFRLHGTWYAKQCVRIKGHPQRHRILAINIGIGLWKEGTKPAMVARFNISFSTWIQKYDIWALTANREYTCELLCGDVIKSIFSRAFRYVLCDNCYGHDFVTDPKEALHDMRRLSELIWTLMRNDCIIIRLSNTEAYSLVRKILSRSTSNFEFYR